MDRRTSIRPSMADVAAAANVSIATVSRALSERHKSLITLSTQARVRRAAEQLGYRPNLFARSLLGMKTGTLGLITGEFDNPFFAGVARAALNCAAENGYNVFLESKVPSIEPSRDASMFASWPVDGLLLWAELNPYTDWLTDKDAHGLPTVSMGWPRKSNVDFVTFDLYTGMRELMQHIAERGYRRPAMVLQVSPTFDPESPRILAFSEGCKEHKLISSIIHLSADREVSIAAFEVGVSLAKMPKNTRPDVAVCNNDHIALSVCNGIRRAGLRIPEDIAVTGFDGTTEGQYADKPLTTVVIPVEKACAAAIGTLIHRIEREPDGKRNGIKLPVHLLIGATT